LLQLVSNKMQRVNKQAGHISDLIAIVISY